MTANRTYGCLHLPKQKMRTPAEDKCRAILAKKEPYPYRFLTGTTQVPHAVGVAIGSENGKERFCVLCYAMVKVPQTRVTFTEVLNFAGVHQLPVITMRGKQPIRHIRSPTINKWQASNISDPGEKLRNGEGVTVNGNDPLEVYQAVKEARGKRRYAGTVRSLIEAVTYRLTAPFQMMTMINTVSRTGEVAEAKKNDAIVSFKQYLLESGVMTEETLDNLTKEIDTEVNKATDYAEKAPYAKPEDALKFVYEE